MRRRVFSALAVAVLALGTMVPAAAATGDQFSRFQRISGPKIDPQLLPYMIDKNRQVDVMVELADQPVAALVGDRILYLDAEGYVLPPVHAGNIADLPVITGEAGGADCVPGRRIKSHRLREALEILTTAQRVGDDLYHMISEVHCSPDSTFVLFTTESGVPVAFGRGDAAAKLVKFDGFWKQIAMQRGAAQLKTVDIRFADQVVVRWDERRDGAAQ